MAINICAQDYSPDNNPSFSLKFRGERKTGVAMSTSSPGKARNSITAQKLVFSRQIDIRWLLAASQDPVRSEKEVRFKGSFRLPNASGQILRKDSSIEDATSTEAIVFALQARGLDATAKRIAELCNLHKEEEDEPEVSFDSLKRLARVLLSHREWVEPAIALRDNGSVHAEWPACDGGRVVMAFMPNDRMAYSAISSPVNSGREFLNIGGYHYQQEAIENLRWFTDRIGTR